MTHSGDGEWYWTGREWVPARSPDRAWWWNGMAWVPSPVLEPVRYRYEPTAWTPRLQVILVGLLIVGLGVAALITPAIMTQVFQQSIDQAILSQPDTPPADAAQLRQVMTGIINASLVVGLVLGIVFYAVILVGIWKLWRCVYWYFVVQGLISVLAIPQDVFYGLGIGPYHLPLIMVLPSALLALAWISAAIWMMVLYRRYGTWARRRVPVEVSSVTSLPA